MNTPQDASMDIGKLLNEIEQFRTEMNARLDALAATIIANSGTSVSASEPLASAEPIAATPELRPLWLKTLVKECAACEVEAVVNLVAAASVLPDAAAKHHSETVKGAMPDSDPVLISALSALRPLFCLKSAHATDDIPAEWAQVLFAAREEMLKWAGRWLDLQLIEPTRGDWFDASEMLAQEWRATAHSQEHGHIARVFAPGYKLQGRVVEPASTAVYTMEGA